MDWQQDPLAWPGKRLREGETGDIRVHPAAFHMLDVAAAAARLLETQPDRLMRLAKPVDAEPAAFGRWLVLLVALHDIGKLTSGFLAQILGDEAPASVRRPALPGVRHWQASALILDELDGELAAAIGADRQARRHLYAAVAGHHGRPPAPPSNADRRALRRDPGFPPARLLVRALIELLGVHPVADMDGEAAAKLSWSLSGLTVVADWIGSNRDWFPFTPSDGLSLAGYWSLARERAAAAVAAAGAESVPVRGAGTPAALLGVGRLRPLQDAAADTPLPDGPVLAVLEDLTGAGKTEAALILARRMILAGKAAGLHIALPTMATANALFDRMAPIAGRLFDGVPSLALAHSRRAMHDGFRQALDAGEPPATESGAPVCARWIADDRRKAFLAELGVGTIDQALQAVLPTRFNTLRLWGLADRVVVVDEAHAYDSYMNEEIFALLRFQAAMGGCAIVMTATLPTHLRQRLIAAFAGGLGSGDASVPTSASFPGLTLVGRAGAQTRAVAPVAETRRTVAVQRLATSVEATDVVARIAGRGAAVAWVRNAVDDVLAAAGTLEAAGVTVTVLHARFAMVDRLRIEREIRDRFGPSGSAADRAGRVVVASQVIEQSLDLDFDGMVSDLAPVDLLIQRAGRLWRHMDRRPASERPVPTPLLHVLSPDPEDVGDDRWLQGVLEGGAWVYDLDRQYLTARVLFRSGALVAPEGLPPLIEAVYDPAPDLPDVIRAAADRAEGDRLAERAHGHSAVLRVEAGYRDSDGYDDPGDRPTRLGEPTRSLVLAKPSPDGLEPWAEEPAGDTDRRWALSEVPVREGLYRRIEGQLPSVEKPEIRAVLDTWPDWRRRRCRPLIVGDDGHCGGSLKYLRSQGLLIG